MKPLGLCPRYPPAYASACSPWRPRRRTSPMPKHPRPSDKRAADSPRATTDISVSPSPPHARPSVSPAASADDTRLPASYPYALSVARRAEDARHAPEAPTGPYHLLAMHLRSPCTVEPQGRSGAGAGDPPRLLSPANAPHPQRAVCTTHIATYPVSSSCTGASALPSALIAHSRSCSPAGPPASDAISPPAGEPGATRMRG